MASSTASRHEASPTLWQAITQRAQLSSRLSVAVLGCSTTAGCGAADPSRRCAPELAWPAQFAVHLRTLLLPEWRVSVSTHAKNAVDVSYFSHCTAELLPRDVPDIVLLEAFQNLYGPSTGLNATLASVRRVTDYQAAIAFVVWLKPHELYPTSAVRTKLAATARAWHVDVVDLPLIIEQHGGGASRWYALGGSDHHPSRAGHALMAHTAATYVASRLKGHHHRRHHDSHSNATANMTTNDRDHVSTTAAGAAAPAPLTRPLVEECYAEASQLPVYNAGRWQIVDDGGAKQVVKSGLASTTPGEVLTLGPLAVANRPAPDGSIWCVPGNFQARLGYLLSSSAGQGSLSLACVGACACRGLKSTFLRSNAAPFPLVATDAAFTREWRGVASVAVTETTTFVVERRKPSHPNILVQQPPVTPMSAHTEVNRSSYGLLSNTSSLCLLQIRHVAAKRNGRARNLSWSSRVRVDSLVLSSLATTNLSRAVACPSMRSPHSV